MFSFTLLILKIRDKTCRSTRANLLQGKWSSVTNGNQVGLRYKIKINGIAYLYERRAKSPS